MNSNAGAVETSLRFMFLNRNRAHPQNSRWYQIPEQELRSEPMQLGLMPEPDAEKEPVSDAEEEPMSDDEEEPVPEP